MILLSYVTLLKLCHPLLLLLLIAGGTSYLNTLKVPHGLLQLALFCGNFLRVQAHEVLAADGVICRPVASLFFLNHIFTSILTKKNM